MNRELLARAPSEQRALQLGAWARWALEQEALLTPKPALVDQLSDGAHQDMTLSLMLTSAKVLEPYFVQMAQVSAKLESISEVRAQIGQIGRDAEKAMLIATGGVNTHRGAIWALGLIVSAGHSPLNQPHDLFQQVAALANEPDRSLRATGALSNGQKVLKKYGLTGAKEEAQHGFPSIQQHALPMLLDRRYAGVNEQHGRIDTLLSLMAVLADTCVLSRAGLDGLAIMHQGAHRVLNAGGFASFEGRKAYQEYSHQLLAMRASAGGAADLLAATLLIAELFECDLAITHRDDLATFNNNKYDNEAFHGNTTD